MVYFWPQGTWFVTPVLCSCSPRYSDIYHVDHTSLYIALDLALRVWLYVSVDIIALQQQKMNIMIIELSYLNIVVLRVRW